MSRETRHSIDLNDPGWDTIPAAARLLGVCPDTMREILSRPGTKIRWTKPNKQKRVFMPDVRAYLAKRSHLGGVPAPEPLEEVLLD